MAFKEFKIQHNRYLKEFFKSIEDQAIEQIHQLNTKALESLLTYELALNLKDKSSSSTQQDHYNIQRIKNDLMDIKNSNCSSPLNIASLYFKEKTILKYLLSTEFGDDIDESYTTFTSIEDTDINDIEKRSHLIIFNHSFYLIDIGFTFINSHFEDSENYILLNNMWCSLLMESEKQRDQYNLPFFKRKRYYHAQKLLMFLITCHYKLKFREPIIWDLRLRVHCLQRKLVKMHKRRLQVN
ncbi:MAG: hypothetical protein WBQ73_01890 [Candidatus Babeliales bacterium]